MRRLWLFLVRLVAIVLAVLIGCGSPDEAGLAAIQDPCSLNSDCAEGLVCIWQRCHQQCDEPKDCTQIDTAGKVVECIIGNPPAQNVCQLIDESECKTSADCPPGKTCAVDQRCRDNCDTDSDCLAKQVCSYRTCAYPDDLDPVTKQLTVSDPSRQLGAWCVRNSDCVPQLRCVAGACNYECKDDVDCSSGLHCDPATFLCASQPAPAGCTPAASCDAIGANCGFAPDGCGGALDCRKGAVDDGCPQGETCGASKPNQCATGTCTPATSCTAIQAECGVASNGCNGVLSCGTCAGATCRPNNRCACVPKTCHDLAVGAGVADDQICGQAPDGCGSYVDCGPGNCAHGCNAGNSCSGIPCSDAGAPSCSGTCGYVSDGCHDVVNCGGCAAGQQCGGGGTQNECGCIGTKSCASLAKNCGTVDDGCGHQLDCGSCSEGAACTDNVCGLIAQTLNSCSPANGGPRLTNCGSRYDDDCCRQGSVPAMTVARRAFDASLQPVDAGAARFDVRVSAFQLDVYEVTVGRFRKFLQAGGPLRGSPVLPAAGAGAFGGAKGFGGWRVEWNQELVANRGALETVLRQGVGGTPGTWTSASSPEVDNQPLVGATWYEALAFCLWDGGRLPTEAEWIAAAQGAAPSSLPYPWGFDAGTDTVQDYFGDSNDPNAFRHGVGVLHTPLDEQGRAYGDGPYGHRNLYGSVGEWVLDDCNVQNQDGSCRPSEDPASDGNLSWAPTGCTQDCVYSRPAGYDAGADPNQAPLHVVRGQDTNTNYTGRSRRFTNRNRFLQSSNAVLPGYSSFSDFRVGIRCAR